METKQALRLAETAYTQAYDRHWHNVFRFALAWTNDVAAAEDLAQECYLRLWGHRARIDWEAPVLGWLLVTTRRLATDRFRMLRRRIHREAPRAVHDQAIHDRWLDVATAMGRLSSSSALRSCSPRSKGTPTQRRPLLLAPRRERFGRPSAEAEINWRQHHERPTQ